MLRLELFSPKLVLQIDGSLMGVCFLKVFISEFLVLIYLGCSWIVIGSFVEVILVSLLVNLVLLRVVDYSIVVILVSFLIVRISNVKVFVVGII